MLMCKGEGVREPESLLGAPPTVLPCYLLSESSSTARFRLNSQKAKAVGDAHLL